VVGLALKEPATEIIQGTSILLSNKFSTGDVIKLSDGTVGQVQDLKWTDSMIRGSDNSFVRIPHTQMAKQRIVNLSRQPSSQVSQKLTLPNRGPEQIKRLIEDIKNEIRASCPKLIEDENSERRFLVHWTDLEKDNAIITIEAHFRIPRLSKVYWENRQEVLVAISTAVERYNKPVPGVATTA
jgi:small-conductance mechanosensitive channel